MRVGAGCAATLATLQDLFFLALGLWLVARQPPCLVRHQKLCAVEGLPYQLCAWVIGCVDKSGEGNTLTAAQREIAVVLLLFPIRVIGLTACRGDSWRDTVKKPTRPCSFLACGGPDGPRDSANDLPRCLSGLRTDPSLARARPQSRARHHAVPDGGPRRPCASLS